MSDNISRSPHASRAKFHTAPDIQNVDDDRGFCSDVSGVGRIPLRAIPAWNDGGLRTSNRQNQNQGAVSGGRGRASGGGRADGDTLRQACGRNDLERPHFNIEVPPGGYAWWYIDGVSDDGRFVPLAAVGDSVDFSSNPPRIIAGPHHAAFHLPAARPMRAAVAWS